MGIAAGAPASAAGNARTSVCSNGVPFVIGFPFRFQRLDALIPGRHCHFWLFLQYKIRIAESAHFRDVQTFEFVSGGNALPDDDVDEPARNVRKAEHETEQRAHTD